MFKEYFPFLKALAFIRTYPTLDDYLNIRQYHFKDLSNFKHLTKEKDIIGKDTYKKNKDLAGVFEEYLKDKSKLPHTKIST